MINFLAITWHPDPVIFSIGPVQLRYYSILFISGFIIGYYIFTWFFKREKMPLQVLDVLLYTLLISALVGARLGHCFFYEPAYYLAHPWEILMTWHGGLASHGGAIAIVIALIFFVRKYGKKNNFDFLWLMDRIGIATALAGALIRLGNLMNSEIYGNPTDLPWGFIFTLRGETVAKHPTQLYEAFSYLALFFLLLWMYKKYLPKLKRGMLFSIFLMVLFATRFLIEFVKEPQVAFEQGMSLNMGQWLSIPFILAGAGLLWYSIKKGKPAIADVPDKAAQPKTKK